MTDLPTDRISGFLDVIVHWVEVLVAGILVFITVLGVIDLAVETFGAARVGLLTGPKILHLVDTVLVVFVVLELFSIGFAYMQRCNVIPVVMEAGLVAVVRKLVAFEPGADPLPKALALAVLIVAVGVTWYLLVRSHVTSAPEHPEGDTTPASTE